MAGSEQGPTERPQGLGLRGRRHVCRVQRAARRKKWVAFKSLCEFGCTSLSGTLRSCQHLPHAAGGAILDKSDTRVSLLFGRRGGGGFGWARATGGGRRSHPPTGKGATRFNFSKIDKRRFASSARC